MSREGFYSGLTSLRGQHDWEIVKEAICDALKSDESLEFEVLDINDAVRISASY
jgi:hypothetical protein